MKKIISNKKKYEKPMCQVYKIEPSRLICTSDPKWWNQPGGPGQF